MEDTREIVLDTLLEMEKNKIYSHQLIRGMLDKYDYLDGQDKRFMKRLAEGCIERQIELDYVINSYASVTVNKMKPLIRCLMRMGAYQILYMDKVPDRAACNEAVRLAGKRKFVNLKGFVNGVLRKISADKENRTWPDQAKDPLNYLSVKYSMPKWIVSLWLPVYGSKQTEEILQGLMAIHPVTIRFARNISEGQIKQLVQQLEDAKVKVTKATTRDAVMPDNAYYLEELEGIRSLPGYEEGLFTIQDTSSMLAVLAAEIQPTDYVVDVCAAPGGKTLLAAELADHVLSRDVSDSKVDKICENAARMNLTDKITAQVWDATQTDDTLAGKADVVIMDVPCSGLGVMGKKRDIKYNVTPEGLTSLNELQRKIVDSSVSYVKQGGTLLYSTCTIHKQENEEMCRYIMQNYPFELLEEKQILPIGGSNDGFYYARLRRK